jgi:hypothetical protein
MRSTRCLERLTSADAVSSDSQPVGHMLSRHHSWLPRVSLPLGPWGVRPALSAPVINSPAAPPTTAPAAAQTPAGASAPASASAPNVPTCACLPWDRIRRRSGLCQVSRAAIPDRA